MPERTLRRWSTGALLAVLLIASVSALAFYEQRERARSTRASLLTGGTPANGRTLVTARGCAACHEIPGIPGARGQVGPPLTGFARRLYIAGELSNTADHLERWLLDPPAVEPQTAMPKVNLTEQEARDVAAFLYTLD